MKTQATETPVQFAARVDLGTYRAEFPTDAPDEQWFTTAWELWDEGEAGEWADYWTEVRRVAAHGRTQ